MIYKNPWARFPMDWLPSCFPDVHDWRSFKLDSETQISQLLMWIPLYCHLKVLTTSLRAIVKAFPGLISLNVPLRFPSNSTSVLFKTVKAIMLYWNKQIKLCLWGTVRTSKYAESKFLEYPTSNHSIQYWYQNNECRQINQISKAGSNAVSCMLREQSWSNG